jgi:acyl-coenzyme A synthetase/AMP-(fatty) acid ligase
MMLPLSDLLLGARAADQPAAWVGGSPRSWDQFRQAAGRVAAQTGGGRWLLACGDAWEFAAGLFGLLSAGATPVLPPNFLPETLDRLARDAAGVLRGLPEPGPVRAPGSLAGNVEFWTSGTSGEPKAVIKSLAQLDAEVAMLEAAFGGPLGLAPVAGTVPHQHIYGSLFRILWPLAAGRPILCEPCDDPASFRQAMALAPVLVSSPAYLSRLPRLMDLDQLPGRPVAVFSSGGPLERADALTWQAWAPAGVLEIYGSTESGGIAWRRQGPDPARSAWTPLADVQLALDGDGALVVTSFRAGPAPLRMEDAARFNADGGFQLRGRLDRTIKLAEKRISLPELEAALEAHPAVARAGLVLLAGPRPALGAAVQLKEALGSRPDMVEALRQHLASRFEPVALPRHWRFPEQLPVDARGKLTAQALAALFEGNRP